MNEVFMYVFNLIYGRPGRELRLAQLRLSALAAIVWYGLYVGTIGWSLRGFYQTVILQQIEGLIIN